MKALYYLGKHFQLDESIKTRFFTASKAWNIYKFLVLLLVLSTVTRTMYVGRTSQRLQECSKQHVPRSIRNIVLFKIALIFPVPARKAALLKSSHMTLLLNSIFWKTLPVLANTVTTKFSILARGHTFFHLSGLEATFI